MAPCVGGRGRKRRKKYHQNSGFSFFRCEREIRVPTDSCVKGSRCDWKNGKTSIPTVTSTIHTKIVSSSDSVCNLDDLYDGLDTFIAHHNTHTRIVTHSITAHRGTPVSCVTNKKKKATKDTESRCCRCQHGLLRFLSLLLASHLLMTSTIAAALPSPSYLASITSRSSSRYQLAPASQNRDTIFIYFNPHAVLNLKVNTRKNVYFNFTTFRRQQQPTVFNKTANDDGNTSIPTFASADDSQRDESSGSSTSPPSDVAPTNTSYPNPVVTSTSLTHSGISNFTTSSFKRIPAEKLDDHINHSDLNGDVYWVMIYSDDDTIARPLVTSPSRSAMAQVDSKGSYILMAVWAGRQYNFSVEARHIGRATMSVAVVGVDGDKKMPQASFVQAVAATQYPVTAVRGERTADLVFNISAAAIAIIISFGVGAVTDMDSLKRQLKFPVSLIIGFCCQFVIMPMMAFTMAMMLPLDKEILFGLLCVACVPGGGISHVAVIIADGDAALSLTMNLINVVAMLGTAPLWIFVLGQYFQSDPQAVLNPRMIPIYNFEIWFASIFFAYAAGLTIKRLRPDIADAILMWLIKPFLLLASILYITLGVYINMYVFELINGYALLGAMLLPVSGCILGGALAAVCRQSYAFVKTIALETSSLNCLVVLVALRFSLKQPDADLAAVIPIWVMFTIPGFFVFLAICNKIKNVLLHFWRNRNNKESDVLSSSKAYSVSSSVVSPPGTTTMSAPLVTTDGIDDDATISTLSNQKVTVL